MIVGFTITNFNGCEQEAIEFIKRVCILESPDIATNIVKAGPGVNIFSKGVSLSELNEQPFSATPIETRDGKLLLVSFVNFNLELLYNGRTIRLMPTEYIYIGTDEVSQFDLYLKQGLVGVLSEETSGVQKWILSEGFWEDGSIWVDSEFWKDA